MRRADPACLAVAAACALAVMAAPLLATRAEAQKAGEDNTVEGVTVTGVRVRLPEVGEGAPLYTPEELAAEEKAARLEASEANADARLCDPYRITDRLSFGQLYREEAAAQHAVQDAAAKAQATTIAATEARIAAARGLATQQEAEAKELARQAAVRTLMAKRIEVNESRARTSDYQQVIQRVNRCDIPPSMINAEFMAQGALRPKANEMGIVIPKKLEDLRLTEVKAVELNDGKIIRITGRINNSRAKAIDIPALSFTAVDEYN